MSWEQDPPPRPAEPPTYPLTGWERPGSNPTAYPPQVFPPGLYPPGLYPPSPPGAYPPEGYAQPGQGYPPPVYGQPGGYPPPGYPPPGYGQPMYGPPGYGPPGYPPPGYGFPPPPPPPRRHGWLVGIAIALIVLVLGGATALVLALGTLNQPNRPGSTAGGPSATASSGTSRLPQPVPDTNQGTGPINVLSVAALVNPAVVNINTTLGFANARAAGTGMVLTADGLVLTNNHVIAGSTVLSAVDVGNGRTYNGTVLGYSRTADVALVQLTNARDLKTITVGDSTQVEPGDAVVAIGNAGGAGGTPAAVPGVVELLNRSINAIDDLDGTTNQLTGLIQIEANIVAGDSGGPLADRSGHVIGMNTAASTGPTGQGGGGGRGFAIPIKSALAIAQQILDGTASAKVHIGQTALLGVRTTTTAGGRGAEVMSLVTDGPAARAGLSAGDVIISFDDQPIYTPADLSLAMDAHHPNDKIKLTWRTTDGTQQSATVTLASGPPN